MTDTDPDGPLMGKRFTNVKKHSVIAAVLFVLDAYVMNQGLLSAIILTASIAAALIMPFLQIYRQERTLLKRRLLIAGIYAIAAVLVLGANTLNNRIARVRADRIIAACESYKGERGAYPVTLTDLVPAFLKEVPSAKFSMNSNFRYLAAEGRHDLLYVQFPPFGRPIYHFEHKTWGYLD